MAEETNTTATAAIELKPLTDWENEPTLSELKQNLSDADIDNQKHQLDVDRWLDNMAMEGAAKPKKISGRSSVAPKVIRKQAEWRYSSLADPFLSTSDLFNASPKTAGDSERAKQNSMVLNHQIEVYIDKVAFIDEYVRDAVDTGTVIVEVSWVSEEEEIEEEIPVYDYIPVDNPELAQQYMNLLQMRQTSQDLYNQYMNPGLDNAITLFAKTGQLVQAQQIGVTTQKRVVETKNHPMVEVCESANILIDPSCAGNLSKAQFIGRKHKSSLSKLKKDGKYRNLDQILISSASPLADPDYTDSPDISTFEFQDEPRKELVIHTYWGTWDIHNTGIVVPIVAAWVNDTFIRLEKNPFPFNRPPFAKSVYMPKRRSVYGEPDGELLEENQKIIGAVTRGMIDLMGRSANSQTGTQKGFLDSINKRKYARGDDYEFSAQGDPRHSVYQHAYPEIPQSAYNMITMQNTDAESLTGVKAFSSGINSQSLGDSVGGGRDAMDAASKRESGILKRLAAGIVEIGRMFISMNAEFLSEEETIRITDEQFVTVRRDDLAGNFDLSLNISTSEEDNARAQELAFMLQTTGPNGDPGEVRMIRAEIARLRKMPALAKRIEEYRPEPDPLAVKEAELKIVLLESQINKENMLAYKHQTEAEANGARGYKDKTQGDLNSAKRGTEGAKIRNMHSDSDNKDLDYLEKHSGVQHERDLEKQNQKAVNEVNTAVIKSELDKQDKNEE